MSTGQVSSSRGQQGNTPDLQVVSVRSVNQLPGMTIRKNVFCNTNHYGNMQKTYHLLTESEVITGKSQTEALMY